MEPSGRNRWQMEHPRKRLKQGDPQPLATRGNRFGAHGKWGSIAAQFSDATDQDQALCEQMTSPIIQRYDGDQLTVLFDEHGYRDLLLPLVLQRQLLRTI